MRRYLKALPVSTDARWTEARALGTSRFEASMREFRDEAAAIRVAVGAARQHMLKWGHQPGDFAEELHRFEVTLHDHR